MKSVKYIVFAAVLAGMACAASAKSGERLAALYQMNSEMEAKLQAQVGDAMLGPGNAFFFLEIKAEAKSNDEEESKGGVGELRTETPEAPAANEAAAQGKEDGKKDGKDKKHGSMQTARQSKKTAERKSSFKFHMWPVKVTVLHNAAVSREKLKAVKEALLALYPEKLKGEDIIFIPAVYDQAPSGKAEASAD